LHRSRSWCHPDAYIDRHAGRGSFVNPSAATPEHVDVLIVGAGLSGIGAACHLQNEVPGTTYAILEQHHRRDAVQFRGPIDDGALELRSITAPLGTRGAS
jgi:hypothetical protein